MKEKTGIIQNNDYSRSSTTAGSEWLDDNDSEAVKEAREALKNRFKKSNTQKPSSTNIQQEPTKTPTATGGKEMRNWMGVSDKVSAKQME